MLYTLSFKNEFIVFAESECENVSIFLVRWWRLSFLKITCGATTVATGLFSFLIVNCIPQQIILTEPHAVVGEIDSWIESMVLQPC